MIDFKIDSIGDISLVNSIKFPIFKINFSISELPQFKINFRTMTKQRYESKDNNRLKINFQTYNKNPENITNQEIAVVKDAEEKAQSIAIRLKTELNELQNFFNDFGSELNKMRHTDLISTKNHERIREYVEKAVSDIINADDITVNVERLTLEPGNFKLETLKISISDTNGKIIYTYTI